MSMSPSLWMIDCYSIVNWQRTIETFVALRPISPPPHRRTETNSGYASSTLSPSVQFVHMSMFFLPRRIAWRKFIYFFECQIARNDSRAVSPIWYFACLSKQHGTTRLSHVTDAVCQRNQQWFARSDLIW